MTKQRMRRRDFLRQSLWLGAGALAPAGTIKKVFAQIPGMSVRRSGRYDESFIFDRKPFTWPGGKTLAVWIIPNVEVWSFDSPAGQAISPNTANIVPDVINYAWREYGIRVGLWRIAEVLDAAGVRATVALNSSVCELFPKALEEMKKRRWEFMGHGITNSKTLAGLSLDQEKEVIRTVLRTIEQTSGERPKGWLGPGLTETVNTPDILAEEGVTYLGDWNNDDQPYPLKVKKGKLLSVPYCMEINDIGLDVRHGYTGEQYLKAVMDQFEALHSESAKISRVMGIPLHPFLTGQPLRIKYLREAIKHMQGYERVWFATGSEIAEAYQKAVS